MDEPLYYSSAKYRARPGFLITNLEAMKKSAIAGALLILMPVISHGQSMDAAEIRKLNHDQSVRAEQEYLQKKRKEEAKNIAAMAQLPRGSEDSCKRDKQAHISGPDYSTLNCQLGGIVELDDLRNAGWIVVNKMEGQYGFEDYLIRKAR
ncbi:hypothetical protein PI93_017990 [Pandoraea fibrosis]|uniref:Uncharacterized protein n=2 Tax=Burkholderiaceae TaxID=119060 RepID=A0ABX6HTR7_9BURK|nr:hypothetical protein [Pandoraea fibrosis]QHE92117.1 hypothetical protein PJ20_010010 [Pandoraea fibrosis]QHF14326.1 hypothetical protein PI93_017990 [Pandoraea fibrosis]